MPRWSKSLPVALWPPADRAAWQAAMTPGDPFEPGGIAASWSAATRRNTACGYGRFLVWLKERGELDEAVGPAARLMKRQSPSGTKARRASPSSWMRDWMVWPRLLRRISSR